jgi:hypothetical protein
MIEIQIKTEHFRKSPGYGSIDECPLALACKDYFSEGTRIRAGGHTVHINRESYKIDDYWGNPNGNLRCEEINEMVSDAKNGKEIPTVTVTLTKLEY